MKSPKPEAASPGDADGFGNGLQFFQDKTPPAQRRRRFVFLAAWTVISGLLIWPVYPFFAGVRPLVAGLPLSLAWVLMNMVLMCAFLLWLFLGDERETRETARGEGASDG